MNNFLENVGNAFPVFSTFFLCANQTNYTVYNELCTIYIPHTIILAGGKRRILRLRAWAGALSFIAKMLLMAFFLHA